jgi:hypothetical protein
LECPIHGRPQIGELNIIQNGKLLSINWKVCEREVLQNASYSTTDCITSTDTKKGKVSCAIECKRGYFYGEIANPANHFTVHCLMDGTSKKLVPKPICNPYSWLFLR